MMPTVAIEFGQANKHSLNLRAKKMSCKRVNMWQLGQLTAKKL